LLASRISAVFTFSRIASGLSTPMGGCGVPRAALGPDAAAGLEPDGVCFAALHDSN
jgi:hypothetical protein